MATENWTNLMETVLVLCFIIVGFGFYQTYLLNIIENLLIEQNNHIDMINSMAQELHDLGSPNVKMVANDKT